jgi:hypothetical protein
MKEAKLLDKTLHMMKSTSLKVREICREADLSTRWYYDLLSGDIKDPSVNRVQRLYDYLSSHER